MFISCFVGWLVVFAVLPLNLFLLQSTSRWSSDDLCAWKREEFCETQRGMFLTCWGNCQGVITTMPKLKRPRSNYYVIADECCLCDEGMTIRMRQKNGFSLRENERGEDQGFSWAIADVIANWCRRWASFFSGDSKITPNFDYLLAGNKFPLWRTYCTCIEEHKHIFCKSKKIFIVGWNTVKLRGDFSRWSFFQDVVYSYKTWRVCPVLGKL